MMSASPRFVIRELAMRIVAWVESMCLPLRRPRMDGISSSFHLSENGGLRVRRSNFDWVSVSRLKVSVMS